MNFFSVVPPVAGFAPNENVGTLPGAVAGFAPKENFGAATAGASPVAALSPVAAGGLLGDAAPNVKDAGPAAGRAGAIVGPTLTPLFCALAGEVVDWDGGESGPVDKPPLSDVA